VSITWPADSRRDEQRDLRAVAHGRQALGRGLAVGHDDDRRLERDDARDAALGVLG
jgi:hypothetical protein